MYKRIGKNVKIYPMAKIIFPENVEIGDNVIIDDFVLIMAKKKVIIGNNVHIASFTNIAGNDEFIMEDFSTISSGVRIFTSTDEYSESSLSNPTVPDDYKNVYTAPVVIRRYGLVGANTVILPGSVVSEGTSIGANSLVNCVTDEYSLYVGTPIRKIKDKKKDKFEELERRYLTSNQNIDVKR